MKKLENRQKRAGAGLGEPRLWPWQTPLELTAGKNPMQRSSESDFDTEIVLPFPILIHLPKAPGF